MIIDCHTHLNNYHDETVDGLDESLRRAADEMRRNRVDIALVLTSYKVTPGRPSTRRWSRPRAACPTSTSSPGIELREVHEPTHLDELRALLVEGDRSSGLKLYPGYQPFYPAIQSSSRSTAGGGVRRPGHDPHRRHLRARAAR